MARVWEAVDKRTGSYVALKEMLIDPTREDDRAERFRREARAAAGLLHPNICRVRGFGGDDDGGLFIAFELCTGGSLVDLMKSMKRVPPQVAALVCAQLLDALACAHEQGIVHRDLKPSNVMLGADGAVKLVDFGIAKIKDEDALTQTGMFVGTPAYMSPEQVEGEELDGRSDLFALGILLHEALTGKNPYASTNPAMCLTKIMKEDVPPLHEVAPWVPAALARLHAGLVARHKRARFPNARAAWWTLQPYVDAVRAQCGDDVLAAALVDPVGVAHRLMTATALDHVKHARVLMLRGPGARPAAALALHRAHTALPHDEETRRALRTLCAEEGFTFGRVDDQRVVHAMLAVEDDPRSPAVLKHAADLCRAHGQLFHASVYLRRCLALCPKDERTADLLRDLVHGPAEVLVEVTSPRLHLTPPRPRAPAPRMDMRAAWAHASSSAAG